MSGDKKETLSDQSVFSLKTWTRNIGLVDVTDTGFLGFLCNFPDESWEVFLAGPDSQFHFISDFPGLGR